MWSLGVPRNTAKPRGIHLCIPHVVATRGHSSLKEPQVLKKKNRRQQNKPEYLIHLHQPSPGCLQSPICAMKMGKHDLGRWWEQAETKYPGTHSSCIGLQ